MNLNRDLITDDFRFIGNLHTTVRQLYICTNIVKIIGNKHLSKVMLLELMRKWSTEEEKTNEIYKNRKGKATEDGRPTTALGKYIELCDTLGLVTNLNNFYGSSRISYLLVYFSKFNNHKKKYLTEGEIAFYLYLLLCVDADGILLVLQMLSDFPKGLNQKDLQRQFKDALNLRLTAKQDFATIKAKEQLGEKYRSVNYSWKNPEKYAEHIIIPRCEWLRDLDLIEISRDGFSTNYVINENGKKLYDESIILPGTNIRDVNEAWLSQRAFFVLGVLIAKDKNIKTFYSLQESERVLLLGNTLKKAMQVVKTSVAFKYSLFDTLLFISLDHLLFNNIVTEFSNTIDEIRKGFEFDGQLFTIKESGRINENYISVRPI